MSKIAELFRQSPFEPLRLHMDKVMECVSHVKPMFERARDQNYESLKELVRLVFKQEHQADIIKDDIRQTIPKSFFLPVYRGDLLGYLAMQDDMADSVEDIGVLLTIKHLAMPAKLVDQVFEYVEKILWTADKACDVSKELTVLVEKGFNGEQVDRILGMVAVVERAEWEADRKQYEVSQALFALEDELKPADLLLWFRIFAVLGELANHAEKAADRVRRMLAK
ncbi:MAG TPA: TIGR00153 family protein [Phycisphaerae bacterium]|nr:TIGR00153 family protein [Phycisphaerae bacterium]